MVPFHLRFCRRPRPRRTPRPPRGIRFNLPDDTCIRAMRIRHNAWSSLRYLKRFAGGEESFLYAYYTRMHSFGKIVYYLGTQAFNRHQQSFIRSQIRSTKKFRAKFDEVFDKCLFLAVRGYLITPAQASTIR